VRTGNNYVKATITTLAAAAAALISLAVPASATVSTGPVRPQVGTQQHNVSMCGTNLWTYVNVAPRLKVHDSADTCVDAEKFHADFAVTRASTQAWQYPNLSDGYELGESGCPSTADLKGGLCSNLPVQWKKDGTPVASGADWLARGTYNDSFDIWFAPVKGQTSYQDRKNDVEIMIWLAHPGINDTSHFVRYEDIDGTRWGVMTWEAGKGSNRWRYVAYLAPRTSLGTLKFSNLWLNPFFRDASSHGELPSQFWLTAIDKGFELVSGGVGDNVHEYTLKDVK
jgi:Glycosyl hydrolase family 12